MSAGDALTRVRIMESYRGDTVVSADPGTRYKQGLMTCRLWNRFSRVVIKQAEDICAIAERMQKRGAVVGTASHDDISIIPLCEGGRRRIPGGEIILWFNTAQNCRYCVGDITEGDVKAVATDRSDTIGAMILGFNVKLPQMPDFRPSDSTYAMTFPIIYDALEWVENGEGNGN